jgi:hypothetical protein
MCGEGYSLVSPTKILPACDVECNASDAAIAYLGHGTKGASAASIWLYKLPPSTVPNLNRWIMVQGKYDFQQRAEIGILAL